MTLAFDSEHTRPTLNLTWALAALLAVGACGDDQGSGSTISGGAKPATDAGDGGRSNFDFGGSPTTTGGGSSGGTGNVSVTPTGGTSSGGDGGTAVVPPPTPPDPPPTPANWSDPVMHSEGASVGYPRVAMASTGPGHVLVNAANIDVIEFDASGWGSSSTLFDGTAWYGGDLDMNSTGQALAVWNGRQPAADFTATGSARDPVTGWAAWSFIGPPVGEDATEMTVSLSENGTGFAAYIHDGPDLDDWTIQANRFDGTAWEAPFVLEPAAFNSLAYPALATNASGQAMAVWRTDGILGRQVSARFFDGTAWSSETRISPDSTGDGGTHSVVALNDAGQAIALFVFWQDRAYRVFSTTFDPLGGWSVPVLIESPEAGDAYVGFPSIAMDPNGNAIALWRQNLTDGDRRAWGARYDATTGWGTPEIISPEGYSVNTETTVAVAVNGDAVVAWDAEKDGWHSLWLNRYVSGGGWQTAERIDDGSDRGFDIDVASDDAGNATLVWTKYDVGVFASYFTNPG